MNDVVNLNYESKKQWLKAVLLGVLIGLAVILPGISGATIAIIFGLYSGMIYSLGNIFKHFKNCFLFLLPIGIGIVFGFVFGFFFVQEVFEAQPFIVICLFAGLMIGSFPAVNDEIKGIKWNAKRIVLFALGVVIPVAIGLVSIFVQSSNSGPIVATPALMIAYLLIGFVVSLTQIVPGLSCSALLMAFGQFGAILASVHLDYLKENPLVLVPLALLAVGFLAGIVVFSKILNRLFETRRNNTFTMIVGLSVGSIITMFLNPEIYAVYTEWGSAGEVLKDVGIGVPLLAVGMVVSYLLVRYQRKADSKSKSENPSESKTVTDEKEGGEDLLKES